MKVVPLERSERLLNAQTVADRLGIAPSTLRTYTAYFRRYGHVFLKQHRNVMYTEEDVTLFVQMIQLHQTSYGTIDECVASVFGQPPKQKDPQFVTVEVLQDTIQQLKQELDARVSERDRTLLQLIRDIQETKRELAASKQKKPWWKFWG